jgi:hypothetical protein
LPKKEGKVSKQADEQPKKNGINWTPIGIGLIALGGLFLGWKIIQTIGGSGTVPKEVLDQIHSLEIDWQAEFAQAKSYQDTIYADGRTPTDQEVATLSNYIDAIKKKEDIAYQITLPYPSVWIEFGQMVIDIGIGLGIAVGSVIAGYGAIRLLKRWHDKNNPPRGGYPCPYGDVAPFATEGALKNHVNTVHPVNPVGAPEAQVNFAYCSDWVQNAVAVESYYDMTFSPWTGYSLSELVNLRWGLVSAWVAVLAALTEQSYLLAAVLAL